jgi:hypothetical protein
MRKMVASSYQLQMLLARSFTVSAMMIATVIMMTMKKMKMMRKMIKMMREFRSQYLET